MAPTIQISAEDTLKTLQNVVKRRLDANRILKEREKKVLSVEDYRLLEVNLDSKPHLQPEDFENTKASIYYIRQKFIRYCDHSGLREWRTAILKQSCTKGRIMSFLRWICVTYLATKRKRGKRKSVNQYWRDFKMLFRRMNDGCPVNGDDASEVVKYINTVLKVDFDLDSTLKPKPVVGPDDLLLLLVQHWARDESVFPTEDDRHDLATIMLFNAYTGGRPAEFVHASKGKASQDPLGEADDTSKLERLPSVPGKDYDDESDAGDGHTLLLHLELANMDHLADFFLFEGHSSRSGFVLLLIVSVVLVCLTPHRLYFHQLSKINGPKLAALMTWYQIYYDVWLNGQSTLHIGKLHKSIVHISDPELYESIYSSTQHFSKYAPHQVWVGAPTSSLTRIPYAVHRIRRAVQNPFFQSKL